MESSQYDAFKVAQSQVDRACKILNYSDSTCNVLREPLREVHASITIRMDSGKLKTFKAFRVQHNNFRGPYKGGIRWHQNVNISEVRALSIWMSVKCAVAGIPLGGGKGGIIVNPKLLSKGEKERLARVYIRSFHPFIGPKTDIPAPDVNTNGQIMAWMSDEYNIIKGHSEPGTITGKPLEIGGSKGRFNSTAMGCIYTVQEAVKHLKLENEIKTGKYAVQGFGNAASWAAILHKETFGGVFCGASDSKGSIWCETGMDPQALLKHKQSTGSVVGYPGSKSITTDQLIQSDVLVLYPGALENQIRADNAQGVKAKILAELANGPTTPEADTILTKNGVFIIPDVLANSGGVSVSYYEQVQNASNYYWGLEEIRTKLKTQLVQAFSDFIELKKSKNISDNRLAAFCVAIAKIAQAGKHLGRVDLED